MTDQQALHRLRPAICALREALTEDPLNGKLHHALAGLLILCGDLDCARSHLECAEALGIQTQALRSLLESGKPPDVA